MKPAIGASFLTIGRLCCSFGRKRALCLAAAVLLSPWPIFLAGCKKAAPPPPPPVVEVAEVKSGGVPLSTEFIGQLDSPQNVEVRARVEAFVESMPFTEGTEVKEKDLLFALDKKPFQERLSAAQGLLAEARAALNKYEKDVARLRPLAEKRAVPQQDLDNALASVDVGKASVLTAQSRVEAAQLDLGYCEVRAPVTGLIGAKLVSIGELVGKLQPTLLATISTLDPIWFYCNVSEVQYLRAEAERRRTGKEIADLPVTLILTDGSTHPKPGKFVFIDRAVDPKTGTLRARAEFANPDRVLRPGMFARIKVDIGLRPDSILVPERAVAELQGKSFVWVIGSDNKATQRAVKVGELINGKLLIIEGLKVGDRCVVEGLQKVREGALVQPVNAEEKTTPAEPARDAQTSASKSGKE
jgi:membrane fusion protein (multidrug efflux system)